MVNAMREEKVTFGIPEAAAKAGDVIDTPGEAQTAADTIREHRHGIAPECARFYPKSPLSAIKRDGEIRRANVFRPGALAPGAAAA
jgi:hypothetical protein